jgi:hypothetical protein
MKPGIGKGHRVDPQEFTVQGVIGKEIQTSESMIFEFRLGRRFYRHKFIVASVQMEYSSIGPDFRTVLQAIPDLAATTARIR